MEIVGEGAMVIVLVSFELQSPEQYIQMTQAASTVAVVST